jgi:TRAP-type mannitol/chloroaromatic compound transport system substrate-binding protein
MLHNFINIDKWEALPPAYKAVVRTASEMANTSMQSKYDAVNPGALKRLVAGGAKLTPFSPAVMDACLKAALELYHEVSATNPDFKKAYDALIAFRGDQYLWWQVAEYTYDTYLIRNRTKV